MKIMHFKLHVTSPIRERKQKAAFFAGFTLTTGAWALRGPVLRSSGPGYVQQKAKKEKKSTQGVKI